MNEIEREELYEKYLLGEANELERQQVQNLIEENEDYRAEYESQKILLAHIEAKRRNDLKKMFAKFKNERQIEDTQVQTTTPPLWTIIHSEGKETQWWQRSAIRYAAAITGIVLVSLFLVWNNRPKIGGEIASKDDTTKIVKDTTLKRPEVPKPQEQIVQDTPKQRRMEGTISLPLYELIDLGLGFGKDKKTTDSLVVRFEKSSAPSYLFGDTLTISTPSTLVYSSKWRMAYDRLTDTYFLTDGKIRYAFVKGLKGRQPLVLEK